ncbi:phage-related integrase [Pseudonocardia sp. Ae168_Ps1]|nr:phage-related integrase [Pseudonocardia sp. Ae168_Ps1]OLL77389.1 phage-related integrase [Pseudonocardia sp. Ae150A_Ps1]OLL88499.1 phage-related integrase [Pseudonocardia sp. Ae263_Ps1]OLL91478.1 phage-related integrase [Pseudonocardia sp. Ae356_Ps1]
MDDRLIRENPVKARSVVRPKRPPVKVVPWSRSRVTKLRLAMKDRFEIFVLLGAGCGLRQGEAFGFSPDDIDREAGVPHVVRQVRLVDSRLVFAPPKRNKTREVPMPRSVLRLVDEHAEQFPPVPVTLPWRTPAGRSGHGPAPVHRRARGSVAPQPLQRECLGARPEGAGVENPTRQDGHARAAPLLRLGPAGRGGGRPGAVGVPGSPRSRLHAPDLYPPDAVQFGADPPRHRRRIRDRVVACPYM